MKRPPCSTRCPFAAFHVANGTLKSLCKHENAVRGEIAFRPLKIQNFESFAIFRSKNGKIAKSGKTRKNAKKKDKNAQKQNVREFSRNVREFPRNVREFPETCGNLPQTCGNLPQTCGNFAPNVREFWGLAQKKKFYGFSGFFAKNFKSDEKSEIFLKIRKTRGLTGVWAKRFFLAKFR